MNTNLSPWTKPILAFSQILFAPDPRTARKLLASKPQLPCSSSTSVSTRSRPSLKLARMVSCVHRMSFVSLIAGRVVARMFDMGISSRIRGQPERDRNQPEDTAGILL